MATHALPIISPAREATVATHAWTKLHAQIMSWVSGIYKCCLCMVLTLSTSTTVVSSLLLKVSSCTNHKYVSCHACFNFSSLPFRLPTLHSSCKDTRTFSFVKCKIYGKRPQANRQTDIHMHKRNAVLLVWGSFRLTQITSYTRP